MNRILFVLAVLGFSGLLSYFSLFRTPDEPAIRTGPIATDLSEGVRYVNFSSGTIDGADKSFSGRTIPKEGYLRLSPISGVSYSDGDVPKLQGKTVTIGKGLYFFRLGDIFQNVVVEHSDFRIKTLGRGNFYLDTRDPKNLKTFSVSALLMVDLLSGKNTVTTAHVFPSTYFGYVPSYNTELKDADILRISTINTIRYVDMKDPTGDDPIIAKEPKALAFFKKNLDFERAQAAAFDASYSDVFRLSENVPSGDLAESFGWYFLNDEKKSAILKGKLLRDIRNLAVSERCEDVKKCQSATEGIASIVDTLSGMEQISPELKAYGTAAIRQAYYLAYYETLRRGDAYFQSKTSNAFVTAVTRTIPGISVEYGDYALLSEIHAAHYYGDKDSAKLDEYLNSYVRSLLNGKAIRKTEFLPFSFFLKEYLSREGFVISKTSLDLALSLVSVSNEYYETLATDQQRFSTLTVLYYTYSKIVDRITKATAAEFLEQKDGGAYVKASYLDEAGNPDLPAGFTDSFEALVKSFSTIYAKKQRELYASFLVSSPDKKISDTSTNLDKAVSDLSLQLTMFTDYAAYVQNLSLDDSSRQASGVVFEKQYPTTEEITKYLSAFNGVDSASIRVKNDVKKDGYYEIEVAISGRNFSFQLVPDDDYLIRNLTFVNGGEKVDTFQYTSVRLEEKRDEYQKLLGSLTPDNPRYQVYVFANYFVNTYLSDRSTMPTVTDDGQTGDDVPKSSMDAATLVFVEQNLIRKDFRNVFSGFPISVANIRAKTAERTWDIDLSGIRKTLSGQGNPYLLEFSGKYLFDQHSFYRMSVVSLDPSTFSPQLGGTEIQILPRQIPLADIVSQTDSLYAYMEKIMSVAASKNPKSIAINLSSHKLIIDGVEYDVSTTK